MRITCLVCLRRPRRLVQVPRGCHHPGLQRKLWGGSPPSARHCLVCARPGCTPSPGSKSGWGRLGPGRPRRFAPGCQCPAWPASQPGLAAGFGCLGASERDSTAQRGSALPAGTCTRQQQCFRASERTPTPAEGKPSGPAADRRGMAAAAAHADHAAEEAAVSRHVCTRDGTPGAG